MTPKERAKEFVADWPKPMLSKDSLSALEETLERSYLAGWNAALCAVSKNDIPRAVINARNDMIEECAQFLEKYRSGPDGLRELKSEFPVVNFEEN